MARANVKKEVDGDTLRADTTAAQLAAQFKDAKPEVKAAADKAVAKTVEVTESELWREVMLASIVASQAKTPRHLDNCADIADEYIRRFKARFK